MAGPGFAQELEPQRWRHLPVDTSFVTVAYAYTDSDISVDPVLRLEGATVEMNSWALGFMHTFDLLGKSAQVQVLQPWQEGRWVGTIDGTPASTSRQGWADAQVRVAMHLLGAPPLKGKEYAAYRAAADAETLVGAGLSVQLPSGEYMKDRLINLGTNRYTFRPEIAVVHGRGKWSFEGSAVMSIYTANDSFFNGNRLEKDPLYFAQTNVLHRFGPDFWASVGAAYSFGGESSINGIEKDDQVENVYWGASVGSSITKRLAIKLQYVKTDAQTRIGTDSDRLSISLSTFW